VKKKAILFYLLISFLCGKAQIAAVFSDELTDVQKARIGVTADYFINASSFTNQFIGKFYKGGFIDVSLKDQISKRTKNSNRIGAELNYGIFAAFRLDSLFKSNHFNLFFCIRDRQHVDAHFSKDFYNVTFYGNAMYAGKTADLNAFSFNLIRYQQFQIGLFSTKLDSGARWGVGLSFLKGEQYYSVLARKAQLFTSPDGQYIDFDTDIEMARSNPANKGLNAMNGFGAGMDIFFEAPFQGSLGSSKLTVSVADIGLIRFNDQSVYRKQDSLFHYTGFKIKSIFDLQDSLFLNTSQDSIQNKILPSKTRSVTATLPSTLNLSLETAFGKNFHLTEGIRYIFNANSKLLAYVKASFYFNKSIVLSATAGYGGYGNLNYGMGFGARLGTGLSFYIGSQNLEGYLAPTKTAGQSAYFSLIKNFN
jgi:hypothetical protein